MKVLITGGAGFIGSHLSDRLLAGGHEVLALDNYATGRRDNLTEQDGLTIVENTIEDADATLATFEDFGPEFVVHAAASYKDPEAWWQDAMTNTVGTVNVVRAAQATGVQRMLYFQTALCYGTTPIEQPVTLSHPIRPDSSYAISKTAGEQYIELSGIEFLSFRLANAYGPRNISGPLPTFYHRLTEGKGVFVMDTRRDFIYADDLIDVVEQAVVSGKGSGHYHISSGSDFSIKELFDATIAALPEVQLDEEVEVRPKGEDDAYTILLDPAKVREDFGWEPKTPLEEGVRGAIEYYRENGIEETFTHLKVAE
ncbi:MAG TPA: NAD-dependent epimerase/dehydratase family protein [Thermoleophilaceae bacterium]|nr:NAD-dependent epimerase/dehydratase family protein [Thermoleophilaceae bacterium]